MRPLVMLTLAALLAAPPASAVIPAVNETLSFVHNDHLGTPVAMTDTAGTVVWRATKKPFGTTTVDEDPDGNGQTLTLNIRFPGQYFDAETGMHYNWHRYYGADIGRYLRADPKGMTELPDRFRRPDGSYKKIAGKLYSLALSFAISDSASLSRIDVYSALYPYVLNNPISYIDPLGLDRYKFCEDFGGLLNQICRKCVDFGCNVSEKYCCKAEFDGCIGDADPNSSEYTEQMLECQLEFTKCMAHAAN